MSPRPVDPLAVIDTWPREVQLAALVRISARLAEPAPAPVVMAIGEKMLTPDDVAERTGTSRKWVYRHQEALGAVKLSHSKLGIPESRLAAYLAHGEQRKAG